MSVDPTCVTEERMRLLEIVHVMENQHEHQRNRRYF